MTFRRAGAAVAVAVVAAATLGILCVVESPYRLLSALVVSVPNYGFPDLSPEAEFREAGRRLVATTNDFHGRLPLGRLQSQLVRTPRDEEAQCRLQTQIAFEQARLGETATAVETIDGALALAEKPALRHLRPVVHQTRMIVYLRQAEQQNCIAQHCHQSCLYPVERQGVHRNRRAAEESLRSLRAYRATHPPDEVGLVWLENILVMLLGEWPDAVAKKDVLRPHIPPESAEFPRFVDIGRELGLVRLSVAGGVAVGDVDGDGLLDVVSCSSGLDEPLMLFHNQGNGNQGDGTFAERGKELALSGQLGGLHCQLVDYNNDGRLDIFVPRGAWFRAEGRIRNSLLEQQPDGTFQDVTRQAGLAYPAYPTQTAVWGDYDNDGDLDLFLGNEALVEAIGLGKASFPSQLFRNNGDGTFTECARESGLEIVQFVKGAAAGDYDNDGDLDLYVSAFSLWDRAYGRNRLFQNDGHGKFSDVTAQLGVSEPAQSFAAWFFDYDHDGWLDLFVGSYGLVIDGDPIGPQTLDAQGRPHGGESPRLYRNLAGQGFHDVTADAGLDHPYLAMGAGFGDLDNDGFLDIYLGTGGPHYQTLVPNVMLRNDAGRRFIDVTAAGGFGHLQKGHGIAFADLDNDGDQDVYADLGGFYTGDRFTKALFANPGNKDCHFLKLSLVGTQSNRNGVGARVKVTVEGPDGPQTFHHALGCVSSFGSLPERLEMGLGRADKITALEIWWPTSGARQTLTDVPLDHWVSAREDESGFEIIPLKPLDFERHVQAAETPQGDEEEGS